jgi:predicted alpha/beta hydrolase
VRSLQAQGFDVFVFGQRTDPLASPPLDRKPFDVDTLADDDVCKAIDCVLEVTGFNRCGWVGFGFGGVLLLQQLARGGDSRTLFGVVTLGAPTFFEPSRSAARQARWISRLLPEEGELPTDWALRWLAAGAQTNEEASGLGWANRTEGPRLRGLMQHGVTALPKSVARQVARWVAGGRITDRTGGIDTLTAIRGTPIPLLSIVAQGDSLAPLASADALAEVWDPKAFHRLDLDEGWGHIDLLAGPTAPGAVFAPITRFLDSRRKSAW